MEETLETNQLQLDKPTEISPIINQGKAGVELNLNLCQGYQVDPITRLHLCQTCPYHKWRNKTKPWLKKDKE